MTLRTAPTSTAETPLLALHCSGAGGRVFDAWRPLLSADTRLSAPNLLGCGAAETWPLGAPTSLDAEAFRLLPQLVGGVHLFGHSYGGAVALQLALRWPERVRSLTLYEPVRFALLHDDRRLRDDIVQVGHRIGALAMAGDLHASAACFVDYWSGPGTWDALSPARQAALAARMPKVRAEFEALFSDRLRLTALADLAMPVCVLVGDRSPLPARRVAERLALACPMARLVRLPGRGHMGPLEDPSAVVAHLPQAVLAPWENTALAA